jgi:hypothetical protein
MAMAPGDALRLAEAVSMPALLIRREGGAYALSPSSRWRR